MGYIPWLPYDLWCEAGDNILSCINRLGFVPHAALHVASFYLSAAVFYQLKRRGIVSDSKHFDNALYVGWHVPNILACGPYGIAGLRVAWRLLWFGDSAERFGVLDTHNDLEMVEAFVWFGTFLVCDSLLVLFHRLGDKEILLHHTIFASVCFVMFRGCTAPFVGAVLVAQEVSTPFLNSFSILRAYLGLGSPLTQAVFLAFAVSFYAVRIGLNTVMTYIFLREVYTSFVGPPGASSLLYSPAEQIVLAVVLSGAWLLQCSWARLIFKNLLKAAKGAKVD